MTEKAYGFDGYRIEGLLGQVTAVIGFGTRIHVGAVVVVGENKPQVVGRDFLQALRVVIICRPYEEGTWELGTDPEKEEEEEPAREGTENRDSDAEEPKYHTDTFSVYSFPSTEELNFGPYEDPDEWSGEWEGDGAESDRESDLSCPEEGDGAESDRESDLSCPEEEMVDTWSRAETMEIEDALFKTSGTTPLHGSNDSHGQCTLEKRREAAESSQGKPNMDEGTGRRQEEGNGRIAGIQERTRTITCWEEDDEENPRKKTTWIRRR